MSGDTYTDKKTYTERSYTEAVSPDESARLFRARSARIEKDRESVGTRTREPRPERDFKREYDPSKVRKVITVPSATAKRIYVIAIDNSGSNRKIADHFKRSTNYLRVNLGLIDPDAQILFVYFSDHTDGRLLSQPVDFIFPDEEGEKVLTSTLIEVEDANGFDEPEAHECTLRDLCRINFGTVTERHLILVSDVVGHGMGMPEDDGCPHQQSWRESLDLVEDTYATFEMIGCGNKPYNAKLQEQFITHKHPEKLAWNFVSLAYIRNPEHRLGIVLNAFLFLVARNRGNQSLEGFLSRLYEKWVHDPIFGANTDIMAKEAIVRFAKYIVATHEDKVQMMSRILLTPPEEIEDLLRNDVTTT